MGILSRKITTYVDNIKDLPDTPTISAADLKAMFDGRTDDEVKTSINGIVDDLTATTDGASGADQIGATAIKSGGATKVQGQLEEIYADTAHLTGDQTIAGVKTFSSSPVVPTPSTDYQASTKKYVDDTAAAKVSTANVIDTITSNRTDKVVSEKAVVDYSVQLSNVITAVTSNRADKVVSEKALTDYAISTGAGDMLKAVFDPNGKNTDAFNSANHSYNNSISGLAATNTKSAIDEVTASLTSEITTRQNHTSNTTIHVTKDGVLQTGLNAEKIGGKTLTELTETTWQKISTTTTAVDAVQVDLTIPSGFNEIRILFKKFRTDGSNRSAWIKFNSLGNVHRHFIIAPTSSTAIAVQSLFSQSANTFIYTADASSLYFGSIEIIGIKSNEHAYGKFNSCGGTSALGASLGTFEVNSTDQITSAHITMDSASYKILSGTIFEIWGR